MISSSVWLLLVTLICTTKHATGNTNVTLTVEGGGNLIRLGCPGTVKLFCEGVSLLNFGWTYNKGIGIIDRVTPDELSASSLSLSNPAFVSVNITTDDIDGFRADFSSVLTVNLLELDKQNIKNITCGDLSDKNTANIVDYFTPNVTALYQVGILSRIEVYLQKQPECSLMYNINLTGHMVIEKSCVDTFCTVVFTEFPRKTNVLDLVILAMNHTHTVENFEFSVAYYSEYYFTWTVNSTGSWQYNFECVSQTITKISRCEVIHTTEYGATSIHVIPINTQYELSLSSQLGTLQFAAAINDNFLIQDIRIAATTGIFTTTLVPLSTGAAVSVSVVVTAVVFTILGILIGLLVSQLITHKKAVYSPAEGQATVQPSVPAGPFYEEVSKAPKEEIELKSNQAYSSVQ